MASRASTYKGCEWTLGSVNEWKRAGWCAWNERTVKTKGHSSSHELVTVSRKKCEMPCPESVDSQACRVSMLYRKNNLLLCFLWKIGSKQVVVLGMAHCLPNCNRGVPIYLRVGCIRAKQSMQSWDYCEADLLCLFIPNTKLTEGKIGNCWANIYSKVWNNNIVDFTIINITDIVTYVVV